MWHNKFNWLKIVGNKFKYFLKQREEILKCELTRSEFEAFKKF